MRIKRNLVDVPGYISDFPPATRKLLQELRSLIRKTVPKAEEKISYGMAGYKYQGMLCYFAGYAHHIGFYPGTGAIIKFKSRLKDYNTSKGTIQFPLDQPLPAGLVRNVLVWLKKERELKALAKKK